MEITEEQKQKIKALTKSARKKGALMGLQFAALLLVSNLLITIVAVTMVGGDGSTPFAFCGGLVNGIFIFRYMGREIQKEHDRIKAEVEKILKN